VFRQAPAAAGPYLKRLDLERPRNLKERLLQKTVLAALSESAAALKPIPTNEPNTCLPQPKTLPL